MLCKRDEDLLRDSCMHTSISVYSHFVGYYLCALFYFIFSQKVTFCINVPTPQFAGIPNNKTESVAWKNGALLNATLNSLRPGDVLVFPAQTTFYFVGGVKAANLQNVVIRIDGRLVFIDNIQTWPRNANGRVLECLHFDNIVNVTFTSNTIGIVDGSGEAWWGYLGYILYGENRPRLLSIGNSRNLLIEKIHFMNSPYWTVWIYNVDGLEIRYSEITNRRNDHDGHDLWNLG